MSRLRPSAPELPISATEDQEEHGYCAGDCIGGKKPGLGHPKKAQRRRR